MTYEEANRYILVNWFDGDDSAKYCTDGNKETMTMKLASEALEKQSEIVHCRDCKYWTKGTLEGLNRTLQVPACKLAGWLCAEDGFCMHGEREVE